MSIVLNAVASDRAGRRRRRRRPLAFAAPSSASSRSRARKARSPSTGPRRRGLEGRAPVETWYETNPGDNVPPKVKNVGYAHLRRPLLLRRLRVRGPRSAADPRAPRRPRQRLGGDTDYAGVILDTRNDGKTGVEFLVNPRGIQYDASSTTSTGARTTRPTSSGTPAARVTGDGLDARDADPVLVAALPEGGPADLGHPALPQLPARRSATSSSATRLPRGRQLLHLPLQHRSTGLAGLPARRPLVRRALRERQRDARARATGSARRSTNGAVDGRRRRSTSSGPRAPARPSTRTINPDFSQIESDVAQIGANERFALFYPEKRPFFLEGIELLLDADPGGLHAHHHRRRAGGCAAPASSGGTRPTRRSSRRTAAAAA